MESEDEDYVESGCLCLFVVRLMHVAPPWNEAYFRPPNFVWPVLLTYHRLPVEYELDVRNKQRNDEHCVKVSKQDKLQFSPLISYFPFHLLIRSALTCSTNRGSPSLHTNHPLCFSPRLHVNYHTAQPSFQFLVFLSVNIKFFTVLSFHVYWTCFTSYIVASSSTWNDGERKWIRPWRGKRQPRKRLDQSSLPVRSPRDPSGLSRSAQSQLESRTFYNHTQILDITNRVRRVNTTHILCTSCDRRHV